MAYVYNVGCTGHKCHVNDVVYVARMSLVIFDYISHVIYVGYVGQMHRVDYTLRDTRLVGEPHGPVALVWL